MTLKHVREVKCFSDLTQHLWEKDGDYVLTSWSNRAGTEEILAFLSNPEGDIAYAGELAGERYTPNDFMNHEWFAVCAFSDPEGIKWAQERVLTELEDLLESPVVYRNGRLEKEE
jgi:hypothetical protein